MNKKLKLILNSVYSNNTISNTSISNMKSKIEVKQFTPKELHLIEIAVEQFTYEYAGSKDFEEWKTLLIKVNEMLNETTK